MGASHGISMRALVLDALGKRWALNSAATITRPVISPRRHPPAPIAGTLSLSRGGPEHAVIGATNGPDMKIGQVAPSFFETEPSAKDRKPCSISHPCIMASPRLRGYRLFEAREQVLVQDEIVTVGARPVWWFMTSTPTARRSASSPMASATITRGTARLWPDRWPRAHSI